MYYLATYKNDTPDISTIEVSLAAPNLAIFFCLDNSIPEELVLKEKKDNTYTFTKANGNSIGLGRITVYGLPLDLKYNPFRIRENTFLPLAEYTMAYAIYLKYFETQEVTGLEKLLIDGLLVAPAVIDKVDIALEENKKLSYFLAKAYDNITSSQVQLKDGLITDKTILAYMPALRASDNLLVAHTRRVDDYLLCESSTILHKERFIRLKSGLVLIPTASFNFVANALYPCAGLYVDNNTGIQIPTQVNAPFPMRYNVLEAFVNSNPRTAVNASPFVNFNLAEADDKEGYSLNKTAKPPETLLVKFGVIEHPQTLTLAPKDLTLTRILYSVPEKVEYPQFLITVNTDVDARIYPQLLSTSGIESSNTSWDRAVIRVPSNPETSPNYRGVYDSLTSYYMNEIVLHEGKYYLAVGIRGLSVAHQSSFNIESMKWVDITDTNYVTTFNLKLELDTDYEFVLGLGWRL